MFAWHEVPPPQCYNSSESLEPPISTPPSISKSKDYIPTLDGLRAVAIGMVIGSHAITYRVQPIWANGYLGVLIFFALSGYLITTHLLREFEATGHISLRDFYLRRSFRILPSLFVYLAVLSALSGFGVVPFDWNSLRAAVFFYANYVDHAWVIGHFWSLSVEEHFYLLWPLLLVTLGVRNGWRTAVALAGLVAMLRVAVVHFHWLSGLFQDSAHGNFHSDLVFDTLLWGCCLAFLLRHPRASSVSAVLSTVVAVAVLIVMIAPPSWKLNQIVSIAHLLPAVFVGAVAVAPHAPVGVFLELAPVRLIGRLSYSLYVWQELFLGGPGPHLNVLYALGAIFVCAVLSYTFIERPAIRFGRKVIERLTPTTPPFDSLLTRK